jgi:4'-phosphopantetheinyl transferase
VLHSQLLFGELPLRCYVASFDALAESLTEPFSLLSAQELERMNFFAFEKKRQDYAFAHAFLRIVLAQALFPHENSDTLSEQARSLRFVEGEFGKPYIEGETHESFSFSLSRSSAVTAIAFGWNASIGVDVESIEQSEHMTGTFLTYAFSENEQAHINSRSSGKEDALQLWTRKEAILKADGLGLGVAPAMVETALDRARPTALPSRLGSLDDWAVYTHASTSEFVSVATRR